MYHQFRNDYCVLCEPRIMKAIEKASLERNEAYGLDRHSEKAASFIRNAFSCPRADVHFLSGGTQTNMAFISYVLKPYEAVIAANTGHINVHETGAVEGSGHKIILIPSNEGKLSAKGIEEALYVHADEHMVKPRMVYISDSTETGTIYTKKELVEIHDVCQRNGLVLFIDGARLGSALTCKDNDVLPADLASICDAFYIGGTKNGLMIGEALVIVNESLKKDFRYHIKNRGAMLAKGYLIGIQFEEAFRDGLYFEIARKTNEVADYLKQGLSRFGLAMAPSPTNQIFVSFPKETAKRLMELFGCEKWVGGEVRWTIRFVCNFTTEKSDVDLLLSFLDDGIKNGLILR